MLGQGLQCWARGFVLPEPTELGQLLKSASKEGQASWQLHRAALEHVNKPEHISMCAFLPVTAQPLSHTSLWLTTNSPFKGAGNPPSQK